MKLPFEPFNKKRKSFVPAKRDRKFEAILAEVVGAFDGAALKRICTTPERDFTDYGDYYSTDNDNPKCPNWFIYNDSGASVLAVAHLDSVMTAAGCNITNTTGGPLVTCTTLDDRLGVYVIAELLPALGIKTDLLLTTGEERGQSTARLFKGPDPNRQYNWMFQFDRAGTDVVMYDYDTEERRQLLRACGFVVGRGSFSDICDLDQLKCAGFNFGVGYQDYHGPRAHAWLADTFLMVARFVRFYRRHANDAMPWTPTVRMPSTHVSWDKSSYNFGAMPDALAEDAVWQEWFDQRDESRHQRRLDASDKCKICGGPTDSVGCLDNCVGGR